MVEQQSNRRYSNSRKMGGINEPNWNITMFPYDLKLQARNGEKMRRLLAAVTKWALELRMKWSINKCKVVRKREELSALSMMPPGQNIENTESSKYLGVSDSAYETLADSSISQTKNRVTMEHAGQRSGIHSATLPTSTLIRVWESLHRPKAMYGIHLVLLESRLHAQCKELEKRS